LLKLRELAKPFIWFEVGNGSRVFLWYDQWHPDGCLLDKYGYRAINIYEAGSNVGARVSSIIRDGDWFWPAAKSDSIVQMQSRLLRSRLLMLICLSGSLRMRFTHVLKLGSC
jgi:hypothetical protein